jgi:hypothetical protein
VAVLAVLAEAAVIQAVPMLVVVLVVVVVDTAEVVAEVVGEILAPKVLEALVAVVLCGLFGVLAEHFQQPMLLVLQ